MSENDFFTFREYMKREDDSLTASMEDYLEMIYRLSRDSKFTRVHDLAEALNVQPPSATKMVQKLAELEFVKYERYGIIVLRNKGIQMGKTLLMRHNIIESFLTLLGINEGVLEETEKIEHTINTETLKCLKEFIDFLKSRPEIINWFEEYKVQKSKR